MSKTPTRIAERGSTGCICGYSAQSRAAHNRRCLVPVEPATLNGGESTYQGPSDEALTATKKTPQCLICGRDTALYGYTYGACDRCTKRAIEQAQGRKTKA